ncbi:MAG: hypothetical protein AB7V32_06585 [Candidatus Berkiella sp.]
MMQRIICAFILVILPNIIIIPSVIAQKQKQEQEQQIPPQEIYDACVNKEVDEPCSYIDDKSKTLKGKCVKDSRVIVCIPEPEPEHKE